MYNISELSNDEIKYICEHMSLPSVRYCFQKNPKEFNKIRPGFTVKKMTDDETLSFLIKYVNKPFWKNFKKILDKRKNLEYTNILYHNGYICFSEVFKAEIFQQKPLKFSISVEFKE